MWGYVIFVKIHSACIEDYNVKNKRSLPLLNI